LTLWGDIGTPKVRWATMQTCFHTLSTRRSSPNNFSSAAHLAIFPAAIHPPECHALFALLVKFNVKSIGKRKTMAAIEPTAGK